MHAVAPDAEITEETEIMIRKALAKDPEQRQQSMEEFHRDLQKCYGQVRFRRTLKTPQGQAPAVAAIPLTKKKVPSGDAKEAVVIEMEAGIPSPMSPSSTPLPGEGPILLTKKKAPPSKGEVTPNVAQAAATPTPQAGAAPEPPPEKKKRTTLPLGMEGASAISGPPPQEKTARFPAGRQQAPVAALPTRLNGSGTERRPPVRRADGEAAEDADRSWTDEPTVPGANGNIR
jgi:hypothetical protein